MHFTKVPQDPLVLRGIFLRASVIWQLAVPITRKHAKGLTLYLGVLQSHAADRLVKMNAPLTNVYAVNNIFIVDSTAWHP